MAKKDPKYRWCIGSPPPVLDRHSEVKHRIVEDYVYRYILTLMSQANIPALNLTLVDGFSGGGSYLRENSCDVVDGSPILMMRAVQAARARLNLERRKPREVNVDYHFIDILPDTTQYLKYWLDAKRQTNAIDELDYRRATVTTGDFLKQLPLLTHGIKSRRMGEHAIFVLDQYDYDDLPLSEIGGILRDMRGAEVILTFNVGTLLTYLSDREANRKPLQKIGLDGYIPWSQIGALKATEKQRWRQILQRHLAHGIQEITQAKFMTLFFVRPWGSNPWDYWLIHLSNSYRAHDVMKGLHWQHSTEFLHELESGVFILGYDANQDGEYSGQRGFDFDFGKESKIVCVNGVADFFGKTIFEDDRPVRVGDIFSRFVSNSTAAEIHMMEATRQLHQSKDIIVVTKDGRVRQPSQKYNSTDIIEPSRQITIFKK